MSNPPNPRVVLIAYDGLCTFEFGCAVEVFGLARPEMGPGWYTLAVAGAEPGPFRAAGGITITADGGLDLLAGAGTIIVPGWRDITAPVPSALCTALQAAYEAGSRILSLCSGAFVLAAAGLLTGKRATTHWRYAAALAAKYPSITLVPGVLYVDEGQVLTAAGSAAGLDLCLHLIRRDWGAQAASSVARRLVLPPHRSGSQAQQVEQPVPRLRTGSARIAMLMDHVRSALQEEWPVSRLAATVALSPSSLHRHFRGATGQSPGAWLLAQRLVRARDLLQEALRPVEDVAVACGFGSAAAMRHHFRNQFGCSPVTYRDRTAKSGPSNPAPTPPRLRLR